MLSSSNPRMEEQSTPTTSEVESLRNQTVLLQDKLDRSVAKVMQLQGGIDQVTDGDVKKRFESVFSSIQNWVEEIELDLVRQSRDFRTVFQRVLRHEEEEGEEEGSLLLSLGLRAHDKDENGQLIWNPQEYVDMQWLGTLDTCINVVLSRFIWRRLYHRVFRSIYPIGLEEYLQTGLNYIIEAIEDGNDGETKVEAEAIFRANKWRAESMATLVSTTRFRKDKEVDMQYLIEDICNDLLRWPHLIDTATLRRHSRSLANNVIGPAIELKQTIACSSADYRFVEPEAELQENAQDVDRFYDYSLKDIVDWRERDPSGTYGENFRLFPGIHRKGMKDTEDVVLVKPTLLVLNRQTKGMLQEFRKSNGLTRNRRHRSPEKDSEAHSRKLWSSSSSSWPITTKPRSDRRNSNRKPHEAHPKPSSVSRVLGLFSPERKTLGQDKRLEENSAPDTKSRPQHRGPEDKGLRDTPPRESRGKEKWPRRADPASVASRKPSASQPLPEATIPSGSSSEYSREASSQPILRETPQVTHDVYGTHMDAGMDFTGPLTQRKEEEEIEGSDNDLAIGVGSSHEAEQGNSAQQIITRSGEPSRSAAPSGYTPTPHPHLEGWRKVEYQFS